MQIEVKYCVSTKKSCRNIWSVFLKALLLQCTIKVVHHYTQQNKG